MQSRSQVCSVSPLIEELVLQVYIGYLKVIIHMEIIS